MKLCSSSSPQIVGRVVRSRSLSEADELGEGYVSLRGSQKSSSDCEEQSEAGERDGQAETRTEGLQLAGRRFGG